MNTREISCGNCHNKVMETPDSKNTLCQSCESLISIEVCETVPKGHLCFCWKTRLQESKSLHAALSKLDRKLNPMTNNIGVHLPKRAVLCGVSYQKKKHKLKGTINDVNRMKSLLTDHFGFLETSICVLTEEEMNPYRMPTKQNIRNALSWLIQGCQSGSSLVFYYTGHSSQVPDNNGDELDGYDESLCPIDYLTEGNILDDEINATIVRPLPRGAKLHAIIDTCKSGTFLDLPFMCRMNQQGYCAWDDQRSAVYKGTHGGTAICFSACDDHQISLDIKVATGNTTGGCMTNSFIQAMENEYGLTYARLLHSIRTKIWESQKRLYPSPPTSQYVKPPPQSNSRQSRRLTQL
ncbi:hypothetical protein ACSBR1_019286 [Camellia fascicularis]